MSIKLKQDVLTYKVQMSDGYLYCNRFEPRKTEYIIGKFIGDNEDFYFFEFDVIQNFICSYTNELLEKHILHSKYALIKSDKNKGFILSENVVYKITHNKIEPLK